MQACGSPSAMYLADAGGFFRDAGPVPRFDVPVSIDVPNPPETEEIRSFLTPRAGGRYVYVANPLRDSVAVIDSQTLAITSIEVGRRPTTLNTMDGRDECIVLNSGANTASILRTTNGTTTTSQVPTLDGANAIAIASDARHAIVYFDSTVAGADGRRANFQDITLITLEAGMDRAVQLTVGFRPLNVLFSNDGTAAYVLTDDGISILRFADITGPTILPSVTLQDDRVIERNVTEDARAPLDAAMDAAMDDGGDVPAPGVSDASDAAAPIVRGAVTDVSLTPDGRFALARMVGTGILRLVDLRNRSVRSLDVGATVSDLDLSTSGAFAIAIQREASRVLRIPIPGAFDGTAAIRRNEFRAEFVGSVTIAPDDSVALLYTTAVDERRLLTMDLVGNAGTTALTLRKTVRSVTFAPDSRSALIVHRFSDGDPNQLGIPLQTQIDRSRGYSLLDLRNRFVKLQLTEADVGPFTLVPGGGYAFLLFRNDAARVASTHRVNLRSFEVSPLILGSPPSSVGAVPSTMRVFVGQEHPEGRISFINWDTGAIESLTGFELNSRIVR